MNPQKFTTTELEDCARRELKIRRRVYPRWVHEDRIDTEQAQREIAMMEAIADYFRNLNELPLV